MRRPGRRRQSTPVRRRGLSGGLGFVKGERCSRAASAVVSVKFRTFYFPRRCGIGWELVCCLVLSLFRFCQTEEGRRPTGVWQNRSPHRGQIGCFMRPAPFPPWPVPSAVPCPDTGALPTPFPRCAAAARSPGSARCSHRERLPPPAFAFESPS